MANSVTNVKFTAPASEYDLEAKDIERRRKLAEALQAKGQEPVGGTEVIGGWAIPRSPMEGAAKALQQGLGSYQQQKLTDQEKALGERYRTEENQASARFAAAMRGDTGPVDPNYRPDENLTALGGTPTPQAVMSPEARRAAAMEALSSHPNPQMRALPMQMQLAALLKDPTADEKFGHTPTTMRAPDGRLIQVLVGDKGTIKPVTGYNVAEKVKPHSVGGESVMLGDYGTRMGGGIAHSVSPDAAARVAEQQRQWANLSPMQQATIANQQGNLAVNQGNLAVHQGNLGLGNIKSIFETGQGLPNQPNPFQPGGGSPGPLYVPPGDAAPPTPPAPGGAPPAPAAPVPAPGPRPIPVMDPAATSARVNAGMPAATQPGRDDPAALMRAREAGPNLDRSIAELIPAVAAARGDAKNILSRELAMLQRGKELLSQGQQAPGAPAPTPVVDPARPAPAVTPKLAAENAAHAARQRSDMEGKRAFNMAGINSIITEAENILQGKGVSPLGQPEMRQRPTGSGAGALVDMGAAFFGATPSGAAQADQLQSLSGALVSKMPRMEGPQSDKDVVLYQQMAGDIGNRWLPIKRRLEALDTVRKIYAKYEHQQGAAPTQPAPAIPPGLQIDTSAIEAELAARRNRAR